MSEFARSGVTSGSGRLALVTSLDNVDPPYLGEKRVVFLVIQAAARKVGIV